MRHLRTAAVLLAATVALAAAPPPAHADFDGKKLGLGIVVGTPLGFNLKYFISGGHAFETTIGVGFYNGIGFRANLDYNYTFEVVKNGDLTLGIPFGAGVVLGTTNPASNAFYFAFRPMVGLSFGVNKILEKAPIELILMFGPGVAVATIPYGPGPGYYYYGNGKRAYYGPGNVWFGGNSGTAVGFHFDCYFGFRWYVV